MQKLFSILAAAAIWVSIGCSILNLDGGGPYKDAASMMPEQTEALFIIDYQAMQADQELQKMYGQILNNWADNWEDDLDIEVDPAVFSLEIVAVVDDEASIILAGEFDRGQLVEALEDDDYEEELYREKSIWIGDDQHYTFLDANRLLFSEDADIFRQTIRSDVGASSSLWENSDVSEILRKLPPSFYAFANMECDDESVWYPIFRHEFQGCEVLAVSLSKSDTATIQMTLVVMFSSENRAGREIGSVEDLMRALEEDKKWTDSNVNRSGDIVEAKAFIDIGDFAEIEDFERNEHYSPEWFDVEVE